MEPDRRRPDPFANTTTTTVFVLVAQHARLSLSDGGDFLSSARPNFQKSHCHRHVDDDDTRPEATTTPDSLSLSLRHHQYLSASTDVDLQHGKVLVGK